MRNTRKKYNRRSVRRSKRRSVRRSNRRSVRRSNRRSVRRSNRRSVRLSNRRSVRRSNRRSVRRSNRRSVRLSKRGGDGKKVNKQITGGGNPILKQKGKSKDTNSDESSEISSFNDTPDVPPPSKEQIEEYAKHLGMDVENDSDLLWIAEEGLKDPLPAGWVEYEDEKGQLYYAYGKEKNARTQWEHPNDDLWRNIYSDEKEKKLRKIAAKAATEAALAKAATEAALAKAKEAAVERRRKAEQELKKAIMKKEAWKGKAKEADATLNAATTRSWWLGHDPEEELKEKAATEAAVAKAAKEAEGTTEAAVAKAEAETAVAKAEAETAVAKAEKETEAVATTEAAVVKAVAEAETNVNNLSSRLKEAENLEDRNLRKKEELYISGDSRKMAEEFAASQQTQLEPMKAADSLAPLNTGTTKRIAWAP